jgi:hypothetical protein
MRSDEPKVLTVADGGQGQTSAGPGPVIGRAGPGAGTSARDRLADGGPGRPGSQGRGIEWMAPADSDARGEDLSRGSATDSDGLGHPRRTRTP